MEKLKNFRDPFENKQLRHFVVHHNIAQFSLNFENFENLLFSVSSNVTHNDSFVIRFQAKTVTSLVTIPQSFETRRSSANIDKMGTTEKSCFDYWSKRGENCKKNCHNSQEKSCRLSDVSNFC